MILAGSIPMNTMRVVVICSSHLEVQMQEIEARLGPARRERLAPLSFLIPKKERHRYDPMALQKSSHSDLRQNFIALMAGEIDISIPRQQFKS